MAKNTSIQLGKNPKQAQLLAVLLLVLVAGGLIYWRYYSPTPPQAMDSSANEFPPHWPHSTTPFQLSMVNQGSAKWGRHLTNITNAWARSGVVNYRIVKGNSKRPCDMYAEGMKFCSYSARDGYLGGAVYMQAPNSPHIIGATVKMNDAYYFGQGLGTNTDAWRNRDLCWLLGITLGAAQSVDANPKVTSCMNLLVDNTNIENRQYPDESDFIGLREIYGHNDDDGSSSISYKLESANQAFSKNQLGSMTESLDNGQIEVYSLDLGDGYMMKTTLLKATE